MVGQVKEHTGLEDPPVIVDSELIQNPFATGIKHLRVGFETTRTCADTGTDIVAPRVVIEGSIAFKLGIAIIAPAL